MQGVLGLAVIMALAWLLGERRRVNFQRIAVGLGLQFGLALLFLRLPGMSGVFLWLNKVTEALSDATLAGCSFLFGYLGGGPLPFAPAPGASTWIFAFVSLPMIIVLSALSAVLFHWGILQHVVRGFSFLLRKSMGLGGALGVGVAANVFMGMVEAPLLIRHYLRGLTHSELFALMTTGMATIAGTVLVLYATVLAPVLDNALGQILTASIISCPAALLIAELMVPESGPPSDGGEIDAQYRSGMDALSAGTSEGLKLYMNVAATLLVYVALTHLINTMVGALPDVEGQPLSLAAKTSADEEPRPDYNYFYHTLRRLPEYLQAEDTERTEEAVARGVDLLVEHSGDEAMATAFLQALADCVRKETRLPEELTDNPPRPAGDPEAYRAELTAYCARLTDHLAAYYRRKSHKLILEAQQYIAANYQDAQLSLSSVSQAIHTSASYLSRLFRGNLEMGFVDYLNSYRIQQACQLLRETELSAKDVAAQCGFNSQQNFFRVFKKWTHVTPKQYREEPVSSQDASAG